MRLRKTGVSVAEGKDKEATEIQKTNSECSQRTKAPGLPVC